MGEVVVLSVCCVLCRLGDPQRKNLSRLLRRLHRHTLASLLASVRPHSRLCQAKVWGRWATDLFPVYDYPLSPEKKNPTTQTDKF